MVVFTAIGAFVATQIVALGVSAGLLSNALIIGAQIAGALVSAAVATLVSRALTPSVKVPQAEIQAVINQTDAPRRIYVGQYLAGGVRAFFDVKDARLYQLVVVAHGPISEFVAFWIDSEPVTINEYGGVTTLKYLRRVWGIPIPLSSHVTVATRDGSALGGDYPALIDNFDSWTADRRLEGQATFLVNTLAPRAEDFSKIFPKSYNTVYQWVIRGQAVYDPRGGATAYKDNAALVIAHYLTHADGYKLSPSEIDWDSVTAMANVADLPVARNGGGTAPNLRLWGYWTLDEQPVDVLARMYGSSGIRPYETQDGKVGLIGGPFGTPACTITAKDIRSIQTSEAISEREGYNVLRVFHLDPAQKYEVIEVDPWRDEARLAIEGEITKEYRMEMCPDLSQARRLAKQQMHNDNRAKVEIVTNAVGLKARFPRYHGQRHTIMLDYRPEDGSGRVIQGEYEVMDHEFDPVELECRISLARVDRASEEWTPDQEGGTTAALPAPSANPAPPLDAVLTQRLIQISAGVTQAVLEVSAVPVAGRDDLRVQAQYRKVGDTTWLDMTGSEFVAQSGAVEDGAQYEAQARWRGVFDGVAPWVPLGPVAIQIDSTAPGQPTQLFVSNGTGTNVGLNWRNPATPFFKVRIYRGTSASFGSASLIATTGGTSGQISDYTDPTAAAATTYRYWVAAANVSGVEGPPAGPGAITTP